VGEWGGEDVKEEDIPKLDVETSDIASDWWSGEIGRDEGNERIHSMEKGVKLVRRVSSFDFFLRRNTPSLKM